MAKLLKLRRGNTSQHGNFTGAEGEVTVDTDKDTLVVHDGSQAGGRPLAREDMSNVSSASIASRLNDDSIAPSKIAAGVLPTDVTVASANIVDGTIVDADVNASAAIAGTKVSPDFGSQNIVTSGTIDGRDVSVDGGKLDELYGGTNTLKATVGLADGVTATTQSASDNSTKVATTAYTDTAISNLVDSSPAALDTLKELSDALGADANFSTTVNNNIATKMPTGGGTFVGDVTFDGETAGRDIIFDRSDNALEFADDAKAVFGSNNELEIHYNSTDNVNKIVSQKSNETKVKNYYVYTNNHATAHEAIMAYGGGGVELTHAGTKKFETTSAGATVTGALTATGDVTAFSDQTLKKDITTINDALGLCGKLRGVSYKWIKDDKPSIGVIAQEIEQHIPEIVSTTQLDGKDVKSVDYGKIVGVLINAVNELKAELDEYKATFETITMQDLATINGEDAIKKVLVLKKSS